MKERKKIKTKLDLFKSWYHDQRQIFSRTHLASPRPGGDRGCYSHQSSPEQYFHTASTVSGQIKLLTRGRFIKYLGKERIIELNLFYTLTDTLQESLRRLPPVTAPPVATEREAGNSAENDFRLIENYLLDTCIRYHYVHVYRISC